MVAPPEEISKAGRRIAGLLEKQNPFGVYRMVPRAELKIDRDYQRPTSERRAKMIALDFVNELFSPLWVADRRGAGNLYVVDGAHRMLAADIIGIEYMPELPCQIYRTKDAKHEAQIYIWLQEKRKQLTSFQKFAVKLQIGDPEAIIIRDTLFKHGFKLRDEQSFASQSADDVISAISALETCIQAHGEKGLDDLLYVLRKAWDGAAISLSYNMITALMMLFEAESMGRTRIATKLVDSGKDPWSILESAARRSYNNRISQTVALRDVLSKIVNA